MSSLCARLFLLPPQKCLRMWLRVAVCSQHVEMSIHCQCNCYLGIQFCLTLQILLLKRIYLAWKKSRFIFQNIQPHYMPIHICPIAAFFICCEFANYPGSEKRAVTRWGPWIDSASDKNIEYNDVHSVAKDCRVHNREVEAPLQSSSDLLPKLIMGVSHTAPWSGEVLGKGR